MDWPGGAVYLRWVAAGPAALSATAGYTRGETATKAITTREIPLDEFGPVPFDKADFDAVAGP